MSIQDRQGNYQKYNSDGSTPVVVVGSLAKEPFSGSTTYIKNFTNPMNGFCISNDGLSSLTFTIGADTYTVLAGEVLSLQFSSFTQVTVTTTVAYRAWGLM